MMTLLVGPVRHGVIPSAAARAPGDRSSSRTAATPALLRSTGPPHQQAAPGCAPGKLMPGQARGLPPLRASLGRVEAPSAGSAFAAVGRRGLFAGLCLLLGPICGDAQAGTDVRALILSGQTKFAEGAVEESVADFDEAIRIDKRMRTYLWQRGLSLYYAGRYSDGAVQFREDATVNPNDTEEAVWAFLCEAQESDFATAQKALMKVGRDSRQVMRTVYEVFAGNQSVDDLSRLAAAGRGGSDSFYSLLYAGLYYEALGDTGTSEQYIRSSLGTPYAQQSGDYMAKLARVHAQRRGFSSE